MKVSKEQEERFLDFLERHKGLILKVAGAYCQHLDERKDLVQDIILQLWRSFPKYDASYAVSTWIYRIALNVSISFLRKITSRKRVQKSYEQQFELLQWDHGIVDERLEKLYRCIDFLKPLDKGIMILHLEGQKNKEIAEILGMTPTSISTRMQRIRQKLKEQLTPKN